MPAANCDHWSVFDETLNLAARSVDGRCARISLAESSELKGVHHVNCLFVHVAQQAPVGVIPCGRSLGMGEHVSRKQVNSIRPR